MGRLAAAWVAAIALAIGCNALTGAGDLAVCSGDRCGDGAAPTTTTTDAATSSTTSGSVSSSSSSSSSSSGGSSSGAPDGGCPRPEPGLLAYYPLDETGLETTVKDCSGNGHDGTVISPGTWSAGKFGGGFTTSESAGCIDLGKPAALLREGQSFTAAAWARADAFGTPQLSYYIVGRTALPQSAGWRLGTDPDNTWTTKFFDSVDGLLLGSSATQQPVDTWTHVAATYAQGTAVTLYVNGAVAASVPYETVVPDDSATIRIGCRGDGAGFFHGSIDEVRIYEGALPAAAVAALAAATP